MNGGFVFLGRKIAIRCLQRLLHFYSARKRNNSVARVDIDRNSVLDTRIRFFRDVAMKRLAAVGKAT